MSKPMPASIREKILLLKKIEVDLGVLPPDSWALADLQKRVFSEEFTRRQKDLNLRSEDLFAEICEDLDEHAFSALDIANEINAELRYENGPRYCSEEEVNEALGKV